MKNFYYMGFAAALLCLTSSSLLYSQQRLPPSDPRLPTAPASDPRLPTASASDPSLQTDLESEKSVKEFEKQLLKDCPLKNEKYEPLSQALTSLQDRLFQKKDQCQKMLDSLATVQSAYSKILEKIRRGGYRQLQIRPSKSSGQTGPSGGPPGGSPPGSEGLGGTPPAGSEGPGGTPPAGSEGPGGPPLLPILVPRRRLVRALI